MKFIVAFLFYVSAVISVQVASSGSQAQEPLVRVNNQRAGIGIIRAEAETETGVPVKSEATAFAIGYNGHLLSTYHVITALGKFRTETLKIIFFTDRTVRYPSDVEIVDGNQLRDVILFKLLGRKINPVCINSSSISRFPNGTPVFTGGFPDSGPFMLGSGNIISTEGPSDTIITSLIFNPGQSGSPVFSSNGSVIAIAKGQLKNSIGNPIAGQYVAIPIETIARVLPNLAGNPGCDGAVQNESDASGLADGSKESIDLVAIIDDSASMGPEQKRFSQSFNKFIINMKRNGLDFRICATTTDIKYYGGNPITWKRLVSGKSTSLGVALHPGNWVDDAVTYTIDNLGSEWSSDEQAIASLHYMVKFKLDFGCFRKKGLLVAIILSDEDERSVGGNKALSAQQFKPLSAENLPENLVQLVSKKLPEKRFTWNSIIVLPGDKRCEAEQDATSNPSFPGVLHSRLSGLTSGLTTSICATNYDTFFSNLAEVIRITTR